MLKFKKNEIGTPLTREQMKHVFGGDDPTTGELGTDKCSGTCSKSESTPTGTKTVTGNCDYSTSLKVCTCSLVGTISTNSCVVA